jgi:hypothetical protein
MTEKKLAFKCAYCGLETTIIVKVSKLLITQSKSVPTPHYCVYCNRANKVPVPDNVDVHMLILGRDKEFLGYTSDGVPVVQGEKYA